MITFYKDFIVHHLLKTENGMAIGVYRTPCICVSVKILDATDRTHVFILKRSIQYSFSIIKHI